LIILFNKKQRDLKLFIKKYSDELEETVLKFLKISISNRYIPNRTLICLHYIFTKILISEEDEESEIPTYRKIEKKDKFLHKKNYEDFLKPKNPKFFYDYEKENKFIEKFYRRNILKKDKSEIERIVIVNVLKILLSTIENNNNNSSSSSSASISAAEYTKEFIPELILKHFYLDNGNLLQFIIDNGNVNGNGNLDNSNNNISRNNNSVSYDNNNNNNKTNLNNFNNSYNNINKNINLDNSSNSINNNNNNSIQFLKGDILNKQNNNDNNISNNDDDNENNNNNNNYNNNETDVYQIKLEDKENIEFNTKIYFEILQISPNEILDFYKVIEIINKVSLISLVIHFYYNLVKSLQDYDLIQYSYFSFHLVDSNGILVFLKILSQDFKAIEQQFISIYDNDIISIQFGELIEFIILFDLKLIYKTSFKNEEYICKFLVECKLQLMLKKILSSFPLNEKIKKYCMKLFKCQLKYFDKNWRLENANIISLIYLTLKIKCENNINTNMIINNKGYINNNNNNSNFVIENYLKYEKKDKLLNIGNNNNNNKEISPDYFSNEELKKIHADYHSFNYLRFYGNNQEFEKYMNDMYQSNYARLYLQMLNKVDSLIDFGYNDFNNIIINKN
jgi:hypothetical protein